MKIKLLVIVFILFGLAACKPDSKKVYTGKQAAPRILAIDPEYIGGAVLHFDTDGNMILHEINRQNMSFSNTTSGLLYKFIGKRNTRRPLIGDVLQLNLRYTTEKDSLLFDSNDAGKVFKMRLEPPAHKGSIEEGFLLMAEGDSAIFKVDAELFYRHSRKLVQIPAFVARGSKIVFYVKLESIIPQDEFSKTMSEIDRKFAVEELSLINRFLMLENLDLKPTNSGLYFLSLNNRGTKKPKPGSKVAIRYSAMFIDGGMFDAIDENQPPFVFTTGNNEVIPGLEEAVYLMSQGETALAIIPFRLAYGSQRFGDVPPYSTLLFEITLVQVYE